MRNRAWTSSSDASGVAIIFSATEEAIAEQLAEAGLPTDGKTRLHDGRTGEAFEQKVTVGGITNGMARIIAGVNAGQIIVVDGAFGMTDGGKIANISDEDDDDDDTGGGGTGEGRC